MFIQQFAAAVAAAVGKRSAEDVVALWREPAA